MTERTRGWLVVASALGMVLSGIGGDLKQWTDWAPLFTPKTAGALCIALATVISAYTGGVLHQRSQAADAEANQAPTFTSNGPLGIGGKPMDAAALLEELKFLREARLVRQTSTESAGADATPTS